MMTKAEIRRFIKEEVLKNQENFKAWSSTICQKILGSDEFKNASVILAYMALPDEVDLSEVITKALALNKKVALPKIHLETTTMDFYYINTIQDTSTGSYQIQEPEDTNPVFTKEDLSKKTLMLIPGRAFTKEGYRLGRGKGFYDKYLAPLSSYSNLDTAGVAFSFQMLPSLPTEETDIPVKKIFTN